MSNTSNKVVYLRPRAQPPTRSPVKVWACSCGSRAFFLYSDGSVQCTDCLEQSLKMKCTAAGTPSTGAK